MTETRRAMMVILLITVAVIAFIRAYGELKMQCRSGDGDRKEASVCLNRISMSPMKP